MTIHDTNFGNAALEPQVFIRGGAVFATSRDVAEFFEKRHDHVLRDIDNLVAKEPRLAGEHMSFFGESFRDVETANGAVRQFRIYNMTQDGFTLLAMGFTGERALEFKLRYIEAFHMMNAELRAQSEDRARRLDEVPPESGTYWLGLVREARRTFGKIAARQVWAQSPLPEVTMPARADWSDLDSQIADYLSEKCVMTGNRSDFLRSRVLLQGFEDYCIGRGIDAPGRRTLSNALRRVADVYRDPDTGRGMAPMKRSDVGYAGVVLR